ncbi:hypothetical protein GCM10009039_08360 [Halocalculus aciditolerans]|uniref:Uncharacterized protein n=1 Tax=Halocalculus aciditolerans TaxID=1383812 RepID=A0A830FH84_9EURY|nr:hypothetical protein GCM10009039_08360 [Halocalculus aciditolerans]
MDRQGITHACQTILDYTHRIEDEMDSLVEWVTTHQAELARLDDQPAYVDAFGESVTTPVDEEVEYDDEFTSQSGPWVTQLRQWLTTKTTISGTSTGVDRSYNPSSALPLAENLLNDAVHKMYD